jgi:glycosyltransferase involved in cell wall biosynthesis
MVFRRENGVFFTDESFVLFIMALADHLDHVVLAGRLDPLPGPSHYRVRDEIGFVPLPYYSSLSKPVEAIRVTAKSLLSFWRLLGSVDGVWLLGPHPLAILFAAQGLVRRKRVVLGVRQNMPGHLRARHPGRRGLYLTALVLEGAWRFLACFLPVIAVGLDLGRRYRPRLNRTHRRLLTIFISLVSEENIVSPEAAEATRSYDGSLQVLSVGRLDPEKNPLLLVEVLARLLERDRRWRLVICGDGVMREELADRLRALGLAENAELRGYVPVDGDLVTLYKESHAFLHVSWTEGAPQTLFEAFAAGLPVVATAVGGVPDQAGGAALLVPPADPNAAALQLFRLAEDERLRRQLIRSGIERVRTHSLENESRLAAAFISGVELVG